MAKKEATLIVRIKEKGKHLLENMVLTFGDFVDIAKTVGNALVDVGKKVFEFAKSADQFNQVRKSFQNLAESNGLNADRMLDQMTTATNGIISQMNLMKKANEAALLGVPVDRMGDLLKIARSAAKATGQSFDFMFSSIILGIGRQSRLILDNLGIVVKAEEAYSRFATSIGTTAAKLTDAQRKQAFFNEAVRQGLNNANKIGTQQETLGESTSRLSNSFEQLGIAIGEKVAPFFTKVVDLMNDLVVATKDFIGIQSEEEAINDTVVKQIKERIDLKQKEYDKDLERLNDLKEKRSSALNSQELVEKNSLQNKLRRQKTELDAIKLQFQEIKSLNDTSAEEEKRRVAELKALKSKLAEEEKTKLAEKLAVDREVDLANKELKKEDETLFQQAMKDIRLQAQIQEINEKIINEKREGERRNLIKQKNAIKEEAIENQKLKNIRSAQGDYEKFQTNLDQKSMDRKGRMASDAVAITRGLNQILSKENKALFALQQLAAIAEVVILTEIAKMRENSMKGVEGGAVASAFLEAKRAVSIGVILAQTIPKFAEGGNIIPARVGGNLINVGEAGRDEKMTITPLDGSENGGGNTYVFNGPIMGDEQQAREFAMAMDSEMLKLRQSNESLAFDEGIV